MLVLLIWLTRLAAVACCIIISMVLHNVLALYLSLFVMEMQEAETPV